MHYGTSMSSIFMLCKDFNVLCFYAFQRLQCLLFLCFSETLMSYVFMLYNTSRLLFFYTLRNFDVFSLCFTRLQSQFPLLFMPYRTSMSFYFIGFTILFSLSCGFESQDHSNEISVIIFTYLLFLIKDK